MINLTILKIILQLYISQYLNTPWKRIFLKIKMSIFYFCLFEQNYCEELKSQELRIKDLNTNNIHLLNLRY
jgi:hypothetical protein